MVFPFLFPLSLTSLSSRRVRGPLCSALAQVLAYRFRVGRGWLGAWGGPSHFWQWVMDFAGNSSVNTVAGLSLQKCLKTLAADERAGHDDNARFRSWVVVALNQGKLARWLAETTDPGHAATAARFYEPGALFLDLEARTGQHPLFSSSSLLTLTFFSQCCWTCCGRWSSTSGTWRCTTSGPSASARKWPTQTERLGVLFHSVVTCGA